MTDVEVIITPDEISMEIVGHANYAPKDSDIVCSAISTIEYLVTQWCELNPDKVIVKKYDTAPGYSCIKIIPRENAVYYVVEAALIGFMGIAERYPEYINLKKIWKTGRNFERK